jgi:hypothetical protein
LLASQDRSGVQDQGGGRRFHGLVSCRQSCNFGAPKRYADSADKKDNLDPVFHGMSFGERFEEYRNESACILPDAARKFILSR